jgi:hypothetical protein
VETHAAGDRTNIRDLLRDKTLVVIAEGLHMCSAKAAAVRTMPRGPAVPDDHDNAGEFREVESEKVMNRIRSEVVRLVDDATPSCSILKKTRNKMTTTIRTFKLLFECSSHFEPIELLGRL